MENQFIQIEAYVSLLQYIEPRFPIPPSDGGAIAPGLALLFAAQIRERRPGLILELGSGVSTLIAGYMVQKNRNGRVVSIEHEPHHLKRVQSAARMHGLWDCVEVIHAPLTAGGENGQRSTRYGLSPVRELGEGSVDVLFVDGPPARIGRLARPLALPSLRRSLARDAVILVDDARRADEREIPTRWLQASPELEEQVLNTFKGTAPLTFMAPADGVLEMRQA